MSDTEAQNKTEDVKMDTPAQEETTTEAAPAAAETTEAKEEATPAAEATNTSDEKTNGEDKDADETMEVEANGGDAAAEESKEDKAPVSKKPKSKASGPSSRRNGTKTAPPDSASYKTGDVVLARVKGYPFWPAMIIDGDDISADVMKAKPSGSSKIYCARFFPDATHAWCTSKDLQPLKAHEITAFLQSGNKKKGDLHKAYQLAEDPTDWINSLTAGDAMEDGEDEDELADEVDEEPVEDAGKKRKRGGEKKAADTKAKKAKLEKLAKSKKSKDTVEDEDEEEEEAPKPVSKKAASKPKSKKEVKEPEAAEEDDASDPLANDPEAKKVKDWRHKLQRGFLGKSMPTEDEMPQYDELFTAIESYEGMTVDYLAHSKIGKVMKKIAALDNIARNEEFKITERATQMMQKWHAQVEQPRSE